MMKNTINLIPDDILLRRWANGIRRIAAVVLVLCLIALASVFYRQRTILDDRRAELGSAIQEKEKLLSRSAVYTELTNKLKQAQGAETELKKRLSQAGELAGRRISWATLLKRLSREAPKEVWLKSLSSSDAAGGQKRLRFIGSAVSNAAVADFVFMLENTPYFQDVVLAYSQKKESQGGSFYEFEINLAVKKTEEIVYEW